MTDYETELEIRAERARLQAELLGSAAKWAIRGLIAIFAVFILSVVLVLIIAWA